MPTQSIYIGWCKDEKADEIIEKIRSKYECFFIPKIATMEGGSSAYGKICDQFSSFRLEDVNQFKPCNELIDFINENSIKSTGFQRQRYLSGYETVMASNPSRQDVMEIEVSRLVSDFLMIEGARQSINPAEIIRELINFYLKIRRAVNSGDKAKSDEIISLFNTYLRK